MEKDNPNQRTLCRNRFCLPFDAFYCGRLHGHEGKFHSFSSKNSDGQHFTVTWRDA